MLLAARTMPPTETGSPLSEVWPWLIVFVVVVLVGGVVIGVVRKWMRASDDSEQIGFTLGDLRDLHREGKLSTEELKLAEEKIISKVQSGISAETRAELDRIRPRKSSSQPESSENSDPDPKD